MRILEKTFAHLTETLEAAERAQEQAESAGFLQRVDARVKVIGAIFMTIALVSVRHLIPLLGGIVLLTALALLSKIGWRRLAAAWASGFFFAALIAIPSAIFSSMNLAALLFLRSEASLTCWLLVIMTTPFNRVLRALRWLRAPLVFVAILSMTFRYLFLLIETAQDMLLARRSRVLVKLPRRESGKLLASAAAVLVSKSVQMSDDVYHAMASRGFRGEIYVLDEFAMSTRDWFILFVTTAIAGMLFVVGQ